MALATVKQAGCDATSAADKSRDAELPPRVLNGALQRGEEGEMMKKQSQETQLKQRQMAHKGWGFLKRRTWGI